MRFSSLTGTGLCAALLSICLTQSTNALTFSENIKDTETGALEFQTYALNSGEFGSRELETGRPDADEFQTYAFKTDPLRGKYKNVVAIDLSVASLAITSWGIAQWGWFTHSPVAKREGWFGADTSSGGADKTGHFYMSYLLSELFLTDFRRHGVHNAENKAALSALAAMTLVELGDATSDKFGASGEDLIADILGVAMSWWLGSNPVWDDRIDVRMEYWPSSGFNLKNDAVSDYSGMKHLMALRADGFLSLRHTPLKWFELQAGYYTRGFRTFDEQQIPSRHTYVGLGLSLPVLAGKNTKFGKLLSYIQPPGFNVEADRQF